MLADAHDAQLCQGIKGRCWEDDKSGRLLQQLKGLGDVMSKKLVSCVPPVYSLSDMSNMNPAKLEVFCSHSSIVAFLRALQILHTESVSYFY